VDRVWFPFLEHLKGHWGWAQNKEEMLNSKEPRLQGLRNFKLIAFSFLHTQSSHSVLEKEHWTSMQWWVVSSDFISGNMMFEHWTPERFESVAHIYPWIGVLSILQPQNRENVPDDVWDYSWTSMRLLAIQTRKLMQDMKPLIHEQWNLVQSSKLFPEIIQLNRHIENFVKTHPVRCKTPSILACITRNPLPVPC
jgi:hypothetical protein